MRSPKQIAAHERASACRDLVMIYYKANASVGGLFTVEQAAQIRAMCDKQLQLIRGISETDKRRIEREEYEKAALSDRG